MRYFPSLNYDRWVSWGPIGTETDFRTGMGECVPVFGYDTTCDGVDDDCNGVADEDYVPDGHCGVGYCQTTNTPSSCSQGFEVPCLAGTSLTADDTSCDGTDDDRDDAVDEDYLPDASCGLGYCRTTNTPSSEETQITTVRGAPMVSPPIQVVDPSRRSVGEGGSSGI